MLYLLGWTWSIHYTAFWKTELLVLYDSKKKSCFLHRKAIVLKLPGQFFPSQYFPINWRIWAHPCHFWMCFPFPHQARLWYCLHLLVLISRQCYVYWCPVSHAGNSHKLLSTNPAPAAAQHLAEDSTPAGTALHSFKSLSLSKLILKSKVSSCRLHWMLQLYTKCSSWSAGWYMFVGSLRMASEKALENWIIIDAKDLTLWEMSRPFQE